MSINITANVIIDHQPHPIPGEIHLNQDVDTLIIFSHGFGVKRYSHGMFKEIGDTLKDQYSIVYFDYNHIDADGNTHTTSLKNQANILDKVINHANKEISPKNILIIAHSMGCVVASISQNPSIEKAVLLAGPIHPVFDTLTTYFKKRPETKLNFSGTSVIKRSDGSLTYVDKAFWQDTKEITPVELYNQWAKNIPINLISAKQDQVIGPQDYTKLDDKISLHNIPADHDFTGDARQPLIDTIQQILFD